MICPFAQAKQKPGRRLGDRAHLRRFRRRANFGIGPEYTRINGPLQVQVVGQFVAITAGDARRPDIGSAARRSRHSAKAAVTWKHPTTPEASRQTAATVRGSDMAEERRQRPKLRYEDRADLFETFADSVGPWSFDGNTLRIEFMVTRLDEAKTGQQRTGRQYPVCRLALTVSGANELLNQTRQLTAALEKAGLIKPAATEKPAGKTN
jgi:hypothetical protein